MFLEGKGGMLSEEEVPDRGNVGGVVSNRAKKVLRSSPSLRLLSGSLVRAWMPFHTSIRLL